MNFEPQIVEVFIEEIIPNRFQPRLAFDNKAMEELTASIKEHGIIQPLVLRRVQDKYEIIAGERRFKAAKLAGLAKVPAIITNLNDNDSAEVALIENIQRKNLTPIEEAKSYKTLLDRGYLTQDELAKRIGMSQSSIANKLRLLNLADEVQQALVEEKISERHARSLLQILSKEEQVKLLERIINERMTVKQLDIELSKLQGESFGMLKIDETPLIEEAPSIEDIKTNATDINPIKESPAIESLLMTEKEKEGTQVNVGPMPQILEENKQTGRFFNFLEDEEANMNISEQVEEQKIEPTPDIFTSPSNQPSLSSQAIELDKSESPVEVLDIVSPNPLPTDLPEIKPFESNNGENVEVMYKEPDATNLMDPVSQIETLDPNYRPPVVDENVFGIPNAISLIRKTAKDIENQGLNIDLEELDLDNLYQVVIKIDKNKIDE